MVKLVTIGFLGFLILALLSAVIWSRSSPRLSEESKKLMLDALSAPLPDMLAGEGAYAQSGALRIWYTLKQPMLASGQSARGTVLLVNGLGSSAAFWPSEIYSPLLKSGYQVVMTDHRGLGESDPLENWSKDNSYDLGDMADDNFAVLDSLGIEKAHVLGLSLGGMVGQEMALSDPERVISLSSVMSSGYFDDPEIPASSDFQGNAMKLFLRYGLFSSEENMVKLMVGIYSFLKGDQDIDIQHIAFATRYELSKRNGFNHKIPDQQSLAMQRSGSRLARLPELRVPVFVVHGELDPLLSIAHAKKYAALIPQHESFWVQGMGHDLAPTHVRQWMTKAIQFMDTQQ